MRATLHDSIRIPRNEVPANVLAAIESALTIRNPEREFAKRELLWGADRLDEHLRLYSYDNNGELVLPMGFKNTLAAGCRALGVPLEFVDQRDRGMMIMRASVIQLRGYQEQMCGGLIWCEQGIGEAPTGAGKTATTLEAIRRVGRTALIIVEKSSLAQQWVEEIWKLLHIEAAYLGEGGHTWGHPITVALRQAIYARMEDFAEGGFFNYFGTVVVDEAHHAATAWSLIEMMQRFTSTYRWGVTATPNRDPGYFPVLEAVVGPVVWQTSTQDAKDHLVIPTVRVLESEFTFEFVPTKRDPETNKITRNNYTAMMKEICVDPKRNLMIGAAAVLQARAGHHVLIVSDRTGQLKEIQKLLGDKADGYIPVYMLTGKEGNAGEIKQEILTAQTGTILLSTVAEEGLSIDRLDRVIPAYPRRNHETMRQIAGRVMRPFPGKTDAVIMDVRDGEQFLLRSQFKDRAQQLYAKEGWTIER